MLLLLYFSYCLIAIITDTFSLTEFLLEGRGMQFFWAVKRSGTGM